MRKIDPAVPFIFQRLAAITLLRRRAKQSALVLNTISVLLILMLVRVGLAQENGVLLERKAYSLTSEEQEFLRRANPLRAKQAALMETSEITYLSDGLKIRGYVAVPKTIGKFPVVLMNRGGSDKEGTWTRLTFDRYAGFLVEAGYCVVATQYRGGGGSEGRDEFGGAEIDDILNLIPLISSLPQADDTRIGMMGISRGGMLVFKALTKIQIIKAAVVVSPMITLLGPPRRDQEEGEREMARMIPGFEKNREAVLKDRSPLFWVDQLTPTTPILFISGTGDWRTDASVHAFPMAEALYKARRPFRFLLFEGADHGVHEFQRERDRATISWLNDYLRDGKQWPSLDPHGQ